MAVALFFFTLFSMAVFGMIALFARAMRLRTPPNERRDLEENSIIREEWEWVRRAHCGPRRCPRVIGTPPGPRGDVVCEICAAVFMERHWRRLVGAIPAEEWADVRSAPGGAAEERHRAPASLPDRRAPEPLPMLDDTVFERPTDRASGSPHRDVRALRLGLALALVGASVLALSAALLPGYLMIACGIGVLLRAGLGRGS